MLCGEIRPCWGNRFEHGMERRSTVCGFFKGKVQVVVGSFWFLIEIDHVLCIPSLCIGLSPAAKQLFRQNLVPPGAPTFNKQSEFPKQGFRLCKKSHYNLLQILPASNYILSLIYISTAIILFAKTPKFQSSAANYDY